ncbi:MAG: hypothetical protein WA970_02800 [Gammaproteobacteria bacterium]
MNLTTPRSPGHCLGMLNAHMRTDMLRHVHEGVRARKERQEAQRPSRSHRLSPLEMLIASIEEVLAVFDGATLFERVGPNPFNSDPHYQRPLHGLPTHGFQPEPAYHHDIALLKSQLGALHKILASLDD